MRNLYLMSLLVATGLTAYANNNLELKLIDKSFPVRHLPQGDDVITSPEGESKLYSRNSISVMPMGDTPMQTEDYNFAGVMVFGENGEVYLRNPFSQFITGSYLEGRVVKTDEGESLVFELPQQVMVYEADGEYYDLFACMLTFSDDGETVETAVDQDLVFVKVDEGWAMADPDAIIGMTFDDSVWTGFAEMQMVYTPVVDSVADIPDGLEYEPWMLTYGNEGHFVDLAIDGDKCYLKNMLDTSEKSLAPISGVVTEYGFSFSSPQFLGVNEDNSYLTYFFAGEVKVTYLEDINSTVRTFIPADSMNFNLAEDGVYKSDASAMFTPIPDMDNDYFWSMGVVELPSMQKSVAHDLTPANPSVVDYRYYPNYMFGYVSFEIPMLNTEGQILDTSNLYYNVYLDGELLEFTDDEYPLFKKSMTEIPYDFEDGRDGAGDIKLEGSKHTVMLYREGLDEVGVQSYYVDENGNRYYSELVTALTANVDSTVDSVAADDVAEISYFDISGRKVDSPVRGIYVKVVRLKNGSSVVRKVIF